MSRCRVMRLRSPGEQSVFPIRKAGINLFEADLICGICAHRLRGNAMLRKLSALLAIAVLLVSPCAGFDSYWHSQCVQKTGEQFGFTEDAWKIVQLGNFSPDFFGPVADYASKGLNGSELDALNRYQANS